MYNFVAESNKTNMNNTLLFKKTMHLLSKCFVLGLVLLSTNSFGQVAQFNFPASSSTVVSVKDPNVTVSNMALSAPSPLASGWKR